jgi:hypothetical protein
MTTNEIYSIWLETTALEYLEHHREMQTQENLIIFLDKKVLAPMFLTHFGASRVVTDLQEKIQELE